MAALSSPVAGEGGAAGTCPCSDPGRGNREGEGTTERGGPGRLGLGSAQLGQGPVGGVSLLLFFCLFLPFCIFFLFIYFLFCFISF